jgi:hypothetical protein
MWSENPGTLQVVDEGTENEKIYYLPSGFEIGQDVDANADPNLVDQFLILSDDNRSSLDMATTRIEKRERMINGRMRSYHIADKLTLSTSWQTLPSRSYSSSPDFNITGKSPSYNNSSAEFTTDGGAGGAEILDWYNQHQGSFWVFLSYDNYKAFGPGESAYNQLDKYSQVIEMFITDFNYSVEKRGGTSHDFWNVSVTLEEV